MTMKWSVPHCSPNTTPFSLWLESNMTHHFCILTLESCSLWTFLTNNVISNFFSLLCCEDIYTATRGALCDRYFWPPLVCISLALPSWIIELSTPPLPPTSFAHSFHMDSLPFAVLLLQEMVLLEGLEGSTGPSSHLAHIRPYKTFMHPILDCLCEVDHSYDCLRPFRLTPLL